MENKLTVPKGEREWERNKLGVWDEQIYTTKYKTGKQQGPTVWCWEQNSVSYNKP